MKKMMQLWMTLILSILLLSGCAELEEWLETSNDTNLEEEVTPIDALQEVDNFRPNALAHILEGELNRKGQAVGFHYDHLPSKKGEIIDGTKSPVDEHEVYEAEIMVEGIEKQSNRGKSSFFPDHWDSQDVVDAINEAYEVREFVQGNTYEGLTEEGIVIQMYLDDKEKIISAFPVYEG